MLPEKLGSWFIADVAYSSTEFATYQVGGLKFMCHLHKQRAETKPAKKSM